MQRKTRNASVGRPRSFDVDKALDRALQVFRCKGYEGASLSELTRAMGINRPSLYAAFGDKQALFRKALDCYVQRTMGSLNEALNETSARAVVERVLREAVYLQTASDNSPGCLTVQGALAGGEESEPIRRELMCRRDQLQTAISKRLRRAKEEGDLPQDSNPADLARYVATIIQGMAVQATSGASRRELKRVVEIAMSAWPS